MKEVYATDTMIRALCTTGASDQTVFALLDLSGTVEGFWALYPLYAPLDACPMVPTGGSGPGRWRHEGWKS